MWRCRLAYDGKGNAVVKTAEDMDRAVQSLGGYEHGLYAERWAPFVKVGAWSVGAPTYISLGKGLTCMTE